jgi:hypothetical protein
MESAQRKVFKSTQDWHNFIAEHKDLTVIEINNLRKVTYTLIEKIRKRPLLVYATNFLGGMPREAPISITNEDVDGFTDLVNSVNKTYRTIDILLHSPGGSPDATERIVHILRKRFDEVHFLIPHSAYSAATMLALSGNSVGLHSSATLGPIDPQIDGIPARSIKRGFEKVKKKIKEEGAESLPAYIPLIEKYTIHLLEICEDSEKLSKELVSKWLTDYMFAGKRGVTRKINKAVKYFSDYDKHMLHSRPIFIEKINHLGLNIVTVDEELEALIWEAYILLNGFFNVTPFVKLYESNDGISWGKQFQQVLLNPQNKPPIGNI